VRGVLIGVFVCLALQQALVKAQAVDEADQRIKLAKVLGTPGGTSPADMSRPGFETIIESKGDDTDVSIRAGFKLGAWLVDGTVKSDVDKEDSVSRLISADREPLSSAGSFAFGLTYTSGLNFESDPGEMLLVCGDRKPCATNNDKLPDDVREKLRSMIKFNTARTFGIKATITRPSFKYRPTADAADVPDERHTGIATTGGIGYLWPARFYAGVSVGYESAWSAAGDASTFCQPLPDVPTTSQCAETVLGPPVKKDGAVFAGVVRYFSPRFVVAPRFEYRQTKDVKNLDIPVYFVPESDGPKLTGGVMYRLKNGDSSVFAFVGTAVPAFGLPF
jgi:hypothetical protein